MMMVACGVVGFFDHVRISGQVSYAAGNCMPAYASDEASRMAVVLSCGMAVCCH